MNIERLRYFIAAVDAGNITVAANNLQVSQSAISLYISSIEKKYNCQFLNRTFGRRNSLSLTESGKLFYQHAVKILAIYNEAQQNIISMSTGHKISITVGSSPYHGANILAECLPAFWYKYPDIRVDAIDGISYETRKLLLSKSITFYNTISLSIEDSETVYIPLATTEVVLAVPQYIPLAASGSSDAAQLPVVSLNLFREVPFILGGVNTNIRNIADIIFEQYKLSPVIYCESNNTKLMHMLLYSGKGVGFVLPWDVNENTTLKYFKVEQSPTIYCCYVMRKEHKLLEYERYLIYLLMEHYWKLPGCTPILNSLTEKIFKEFSI